MKLLLASASLLLLLPCTLFAQVNVSVSALIRVGLTPLGGAGGEEATHVLSADLRRTSMITPMEGSGDYTASGEMESGGLNGTLLNVKTGQSVFHQVFSGEARAAAHQFADAITQAVTGLPGFASSRLVFISKNNRAKEVYLADMDGFNARAITHDNVISASPALSPDGHLLAYTSYKSGYPDLFLVDLTSGKRTRIAYFPGMNSGPCFSPDGNRIALTLSKDGNPEIYTMDLTGSSLTRLTSTRGSETSPSWSPSGDQVVYSSDDRGSPQLFLSSSSGISPPEHLLTGNSYCTKPDWSPDGKLIAYTTRLSGQFQIGVYEIATHSGHLVTTDGGEDPVWTRDSRHLVCSHDGQLLLLDTVSHLSLPIETGVGSSTEPTVSR